MSVNSLTNDSEIYLDYNATTPLAAEVQDAVITAMVEAWGNPSSFSSTGKRAKNIIEEARKNVAFMIGAKSSDIVFTSGGTESNNWVFHIAVKYFYEHKLNYTFTNNSVDLSSEIRPHFITTNIEHDSVRCVLRQLEKDNIADVTYVPVSSSSGCVIVDNVLSAICPNTVMISIMLANNETGVIQPVGHICHLIHKMLEENSKTKHILLHSDAAQAIGKIPVNVSDLDVDFLTIVGHKFYAPRIGALYIKNQNIDASVYPMLLGGGQEHNLRSGTENTPMIAGLGKGAELVHKNIDFYESHLTDIRDYLERQLEDEFGNFVHFNGRYSCSDRLPNTCNISFVHDDLLGCDILSNVKYLQASVGASCHLQTQPSAVLLASGVSEKHARNAIRLSVGRETSRKDIDAVVKDLRCTVNSMLA